jgi:serine/threonine protein kinase
MGNCFGCLAKGQVTGPTEKNTEPTGEAQISPEDAAEMTPQYFSFQDFFGEEAKPKIYEYVFLKEIGRGAMSHVYLTASEETGEQFAVKVYDNTALMRQTMGSEEPMIVQVNREIELMGQLNHRYILSIIEVIENPKTNSTLMIMPFAANGTLQSMLDNHTITPPQLAVCFHQVAEGLRYLHSKGIIHRDLKPDNVLCINDEYFVLSDFSVSTQLEDPDAKVEDTKGSPAFLSPEECSGEMYYPKPADVWAYGVTLYRAIFGVLPFRLDTAQGRSVATTILRVMENLEKEPLEMPALPEGTDPKVVPLIESILNKDPLKRPTFEQIVQHEYFKDAWPIDQKYVDEENQIQNEQEGEEAKAL